MKLNDYLLFVFSKILCFYVMISIFFTIKLINILIIFILYLTFNLCCKNSLVPLHTDKTDYAKNDYVNLVAATIV